MQPPKEGMMINSIEEYLAELRKELSGSDRATVQDALSDAEEYLRTALDGAVSDTAHKTEAETLAPIIERYGQPAEVAAAYKDLEKRTSPAFGRREINTVKPTAPIPPVPPAAARPPMPTPAAATATAPDNRNIFAKFFGVFAEARTWGAFFYLMLAMFIGIVYFTWVVTGISVSLGLLVLVVGLPIFFLFLLSVRGIALLEGRLVEALLGVRMPHRPLFTRQDIGFWKKMKNLFTDGYTWTAMIYMFFQMILGIIYFSVFVTLIAVSVWLVAQPIVGLAADVPAFIIGDYGYYTPAWILPFSIIGGVLLLTATMHLVKFTGKAHGAWAKLMLVRE
jgi:hypothetical protein